MDNSSITSELLQSLEVINKYPYRLGIFLEHQYTSSSLSLNGFKALKGIDYHRVNLMLNTNNLLPKEKRLSFYICHVRRVVQSYDVSGYYNEEDYIDPRYPYDWEELESDAQIKNWYNLNGTAVFQNARFEINFLSRVLDPSRLVEDGCFVDLSKNDEWGKYLKEELDGYTGNEGVNKTTEYSKYMLVCWPDCYEFETLLKIDRTCAIDSLHQKLKTKTNPNEIGKELESQFETIMSELKCKTTVAKHLSDDCVIKMLEILVKLGVLKFAQEF